MQRLLEPVDFSVHAQRVAHAAGGASYAPGNSSACGTKWVVLDGPVHGVVADRLSKLMLDQVIQDDLGHCLRAQGQHRIVWETTDLATASPSLLASTGICTVPVSIVDQSALGCHVLDSMISRCPLLDKVCINPYRI